MSIPESSIRSSLESAVEAHRRGAHARARTLYEAILAADPGQRDALRLLGALTLDTGDAEGAVGILTRATDASPDDVDAWYNLGAALRGAKRPAEAVSALERALVLSPGMADTLHQLGDACREIGDGDRAIEYLGRAAALEPRDPAVRNSLGIVLRDAGDLTGAAEQFEAALAAEPDHAPAAGNLGALRAWQGRNEEAFRLLERAALAREDHGRLDATHALPMHRIRHDAAQMRHLDAAGRLDSAARGYLHALEAAERAGSSDAFVRIGPGSNEALAPSINRIVHRPRCDAVATGALSRELDLAALESTYLESRPSILVIDDLLGEEAWGRLRAYCLEATIWKKSYRGGYLSARLGHGFATPLLLQIASELRAGLPRVFGSHQLTQAWAFKYDARLRGVEIHADYAAVNVNFWITSTEASLDPDSGGLILYDKAAPRDWRFDDYNKNEAKIREFLEAEGASAVKIAHRGNRAVLFDSTLFHETDRIRFRDRYEDRRVNVTLLYGEGLMTV